MTRVLVWFRALKPPTLHQDVSNKCQAQNNVVLNTLESKVVLETLHTGVRDGVSIDVVHDVHDELLEVSLRSHNNNNQERTKIGMSRASIFLRNFFSFSFRCSGDHDATIAA